MRKSSICIEVKLASKWDSRWSKSFAGLDASDTVRTLGCYGLYTGARRPVRTVRHSELVGIPINFVSTLGCILDMMYKRTLSSIISSHGYSILLLGPRQTEKSTLLRNLRPHPDLEINFADEKVFLEFSSDPDRLPAILRSSQPKTIFEVRQTFSQGLFELLKTVAQSLDHPIKSS